MKKHFLRSFFHVEFAVASAIVLILARLFSSLSDWLPETDDTSFLNPIFGRIDFLNIEDVSLDAIFAIRDMEWADPRIVVVNVGAVAPVPDGKIAKLLYKLQVYEARAVGIDVIFDTYHFERFPEERRGEIDLIKQAFLDNPGTVLVNGYDPETLQPALELDPDVAAAVSRYGFANLQKDDDEVVRRFWPVRTVGGRLQQAFPIAVLSAYDSTLVAPLLALGERQHIIAYAGTYDQFQTIPIDDVIDSDVYRRMLRGAIVLVGYVNEGGFVYLNDTHRTPMGRKIGYEGPDMAGILVHANIINMLLAGRFITPLPVAADWALAFVFAYVSIALYRVLRTKTTTRGGLAALISVTLIIETVIAFFLPIIAFFFFQTKISYDTLAAAVLLFIPAGALTNKARFMLLKLRIKRRFRGAASPAPALLVASFDDVEAFPAHARLLHAAEYLLHFAFALRCAARARRGEALPAGWRHPDARVWAAALPEIAACIDGDAPHALERQYFLKFLDGRKEQFLRESAVRDLFLTAQLENFNEFFFFEEWEVLLPHVLRLYGETLADTHSVRLYTAESDADGRVVPHPFPSPKKKTDESEIPAVDGLAPGLYFTSVEDPEVFVPLSPFCVVAECKLHRTRELFVFKALIQRQFDLPLQPVYAGETLACDPVLPRGIVAQLTRSTAGAAQAEAPVAQEDQ